MAFKLHSRCRGTGKTTLLLQRARTLKTAHQEVLYISLDDLYFTENTLISLVQQYEKFGGKYLLIDEVKTVNFHKNELFWICRVFGVDSLVLIKQENRSIFVSCYS